jgi:uncharacterized membrane protein
MPKKRKHAERPARSARAAPAAAPRARHVLDLPLLLLAAAGIVLTAYLTLNVWFGARPAFCSADSGCDLVQASRWSTLLGMPMALWGLLTYALLARALWRLRTRPSSWRLAFALACLGTGVSWFLTIVSVLEIEATCGYCLASFAIMNALLVLLVLRRPKHLPQHAWGKALPVPLALSAALVLGLHLHFSGVFDPAAGPEDPYLRELAIHLDASGARFFGAYWCPACMDQKELFRASAPRLPYVECTPSGRNGPLSIACQDNQVRDYPTWTIAGQRRTGVLQPGELARMSGFRAPPAKAAR